MKKFAKILGFLGFFVTLATVQIGTAWGADYIYCEQGQYLPADSTTCEPCPGTVDVNGVSKGVFCPSTGPYVAESPEAQGYYFCDDEKACGTGPTNFPHWERTAEGAKSQAECNGGSMSGCGCHSPNDFCPDGVSCEYNTSATVTGTNFCGTCVIDKENTNTWCPLTCPTSCNNGTCTCPNDDCTGYEVVHNLPGVHYCGTAANACDVTHLIQGENTSNAQIVNADPNEYQCREIGHCRKACSHEGDPVCPTGTDPVTGQTWTTTCEWNENSPEPVEGVLNDQNRCVYPSGHQYAGQVIPDFDCDVRITGCADSCFYLNKSECVRYSSGTTYKCSNITQSGPDVYCGTDYFVNRIPNAINGNYVINLETSGCVPAGKAFRDWKLDIDDSTHTNDDRFMWDYTDPTATFEAEWKDDELHIYYRRYDGAWVQSNPPANDMETFTISELPLTKTWTLTRNNSTFLGWCDDLYYSHLSDATWLNSHCQGPSSYTIPNTVNTDVHLYARWGCADGYTLGSDYQCEANAIDVIYTCISPDSNHSTINRSFSGDATVGATYTIRSVGSNESNHQVICSFSGYYLEDGYQWLRDGSNPEEFYSPGPMNFVWPYTTNQTFKLSKDYWKPNTYSVEYRCGSIGGTPVSGGPLIDNTVTYNRPYTVAHDNIPNDFLERCDETPGYTVQYWTFACPNYPEDTNQYATGENFGQWTYPTNDCYFTANWAQTDFVIHLESNISDGNNNSTNSSPTDLYTRWRSGVYVDPDRAPNHTMDPSSSNPNSVTIPQKFVTVTFDGNGGDFQWGNNQHATNESDDRLELTFKGFFEDNNAQHEGNQYKYIYDTGYITSSGWNTGIEYQQNAEWYAHWNVGSFTLPEINDRPGHEFLGWTCINAEGTYYLHNGSQYLNNITLTGISSDTTCTAQWKELCYKIEFNENGGTPNANGTHAPFYKKFNSRDWYNSSTCETAITNPVTNVNVTGHLPSKTNAVFAGYYYNNNRRIFKGAPAYATGENGQLTGALDGGEDWEIDANTVIGANNTVTLYAQYACVDPYHLDTDPESGTYGQCVACDSGEFWSEQDNACLDCTDYIGRYGSAGAGDYTWTSRYPYTWSIDQCYRVCDKGCREFVLTNTDTQNRLEQFLGCTGCTQMGQQISFYGNEFNNGGQNFNMCDVADETDYCPVGLLGPGSPGSVTKPVAARVDFHVDNNNLNDTKPVYIIGSRAANIEQGGLRLNNGYAWSQVVGAGQNSDPVTHTVAGQDVTFNYIHIIYPAKAPAAASGGSCSTFTGYGYPQSTPDTLTLTSGLDLTTANAANIITYARGVNDSYMSPAISNSTSRNMYAQYDTVGNYNYEYNCNCSGTGCNNPPSGGSICAGADFTPAGAGNCTNGNCEFMGWATSADAATPNVVAGPWGYTSNPTTFYAVWDCPTTPNTMNIYYNKIPVSNVNTGGTTANGNTYVPASSGTPTTFTCGTGNTSISGHPQLQNSAGLVVGTVTQWCDDNELSTNCAETRQLSNSDCNNKTVYAKWTCDSTLGYHLNSTGDDCIPCPDGQYWGGEGCQECSDLPGNGWTSIAGYNWGPDQCYRLCSNGKTCTIFNGSTGGFGAVDIVVNNNRQIEFYGNWRNRAINPELDVCGANTAGVAYCPKLLSGSATEAFKPMSSPVTFMKKDSPTTSVGTRHIVGNRTPNSSEYLTNGQKIWSHIMGPGQYTADNYAFIIYPTDTAPNPGDTGAQFKGYYDAPTGGAQHVAEALGLTTTNAVAFAQSPLNANQIGNRTLYPQYCENGQTWNGITCTSQTWDSVKYVCGNHGTATSVYSMENTATFGELYRVAYQAPNYNQMIAHCDADTGYVFTNWKLNNTDGEPYSGNTGATIIWSFTTFDPEDTPIFTAQYECDTEHGYTLQNGQCVLGTGLCQAQLPASPDPHATMTASWTVEDGCVYTITCKPCADGETGCYNHEGSQSWIITNGQTSGTLEGPFCTATEYTITYNDTQRPMHYNNDTTNCQPQSYVYGMGLATVPSGGCTLTSNDGATFMGWCPNPDGESGCATTQTISNTDHGNKTYYAWWQLPNSIKITYRPHGGAPDTNQEFSYGYNTNVTTRPGTLFALTNNILTRWDFVEGDQHFRANYDESTNTWYADLETTYNGITLDTILDAHWEACTCDDSAPGVTRCVTSVENNQCVAAVTCDTGYVNPGVGTCNGTACVATCNAEGQYEIILSKNFTVNNATGPHGIDGQTPIYTIHDTGVYNCIGRTSACQMGTNVNGLTSLPTKYYNVTFNHCNGTDNTLCSDATTENKSANFVFKGFYQYASQGTQYIAGTGFITDSPDGGGIRAGENYNGTPANYTWYAHWGDYGTLMFADFPSNPTREGYIFDGWWTLPEGGQHIESDYIVYNADKTLYAHWTVNSCDDGYILVSNSCVTPQDCKPICSVSCTYPGQSNGVSSNSAACPNGTNYSNLVVSCNYDTTLNSQSGYHEPTEPDTKCRKTENCDLITANTCPHTPNCTSGYIWSNDANDCIPDTTIPYTIKFICEEGGTPINTQNNVYYNTNITVPSNSECRRDGYSYNRWKPLDYSDTDYLNANDSSYQTTWTYTHGETFVADWNNGDVYHVNLHAYSCDDSSQTGTFGSSGVQNLWEKYNVAWYRTYENGVLSNSLDALTAQQLPTRSGWTFGGYNNLAGDARVRNIGGTWSVSPAILIQNDEDWCAIWSQCNPNEYWNSGDCVSCSTATSGQYPLGDAGATNIYQCYKQCSFCTQVCPQTEGVDHCTYGQSTELNGNLYYPGTGTCQPNYEVLCPRTIYCKDGYHLNGEGTACIGDYFQITLDSQRQCIVGGTFGGSDASPSPLYTQFGENGNIWFNSAHNGTPMYHDGIYERLYANPTKTASVTFNGNGGTVIGQATQMANFEFGGFYQVQNGAGSQYINNTTSGTFGGQLQEAGLNAAQQTATNQTWYAKWMGGSIILPSAQREGYPFIGWYKGQYAGAAPAGMVGDPYTPSCDNEMLYAQWSSTPDSYNISYHDDNAQTPLHFNVNTGGCSPTSYTYGSTTNITCTLTPPTNSHANFKGWCTDATANSCYDNPPIYYTIPAGTAQNYTFYAHWECADGYHVDSATHSCKPNVLNLRYSTSCGTGVPQTSTCTFDTGFNLATHNTNTGYSFNGWTTPGTSNGPHDAGASIQCNLEYLGNAVYTDGATITITGTCTSINEQCPAQLPSNSHATLATDVTPNPSINQNGDCVYTVQCNSCINENSAYDCYVYSSGNINSINTNGRFTITGAQGTAGQNVLNNVICAPATYNAVYKCGTGTPSGSYTDSITITYNEFYTVLPNGTSNGGVVTCSKDDEMFNHWTFNLNPGTQYNGGEQISPWRYHGQTVPTFRAQYGPCPEGEVPVDGECKTMCIKNCTYPGANPGACPSDYPANAICTYDTSSNQVIGYRPSPYSNKCLDVDYPHDPVVSEQCDVTDVICPTHYQWNSATLKCDPVVYYVTLNANGGTTGAGFISKLFEQYNVGWGINETGSFIPNLQLSSSELPTGADISQIFTGYGINCNSTIRMISAAGIVLASPTTLVGNDQTWYACYGPNTDATFTIKFRCTANGQDIYVQNNVHVGESINVPATGVCPGVAFNQWKSTLNQPVITLPAGAIGVQWNHYFDEVFIPDTKAVYRVDLNANGGTFPSNDYQQLWYAVDMGWYKDERLAQADRITFIPGDQLPIKTNSNFNGWLDNATQQPRGNFSGTNWNLPNSISANETWNAQWGPCNPNEYWDGGVCKNCSDQTSGAFPYAVPGATSIGQCYNTCDEQCKWNSSIAASCNIPNAISYEPDEISYPGKRYYNNQLVCSLDIWAPNPQGTIPNCGCIPTACEPGYILNGQSCVEDEKHTITLDAHIIHGVSSDPEVLYTWHNRGVYLYSNYTGEMRANQNPLSENPLNYAIVTFNLNGQGASLLWNGQTYTGTMNANVLFDYQGFWKSVNGSPRYIGIDGYITENGRAAGMGYTDGTTWHARWQPRALGTISPSGNNLPEPNRPGYTFDGWYDSPVGGNQVDSSYPVNNDMTVYAHWSDPVVYKVTLKSNNCQTSSTTLDKLYEKYNIGWSRSPNGEFGEVRLTPDELPLPTDPESQIFLGYFDSMTGDERKIDVDGNVVAEPTYINDTTWYARCGNNPGPFKVRFICDQTDQIVQEYFPVYPNVTSVSAPAASECQRTGYSFTKWKSNHNDQMNAGSSSVWYHNYDADFTPDWVQGNPFHVILDQRNPTEYGLVEDLYELYDTGWGTSINGPFNVTYLNGNSLPKKQGFNFGGYENDFGIPMGVFNNGSGRWTLPYSTTVSSDETWHAIWSPCKTGEYWNGEKCYPCPEDFQDNPNANGEDQCYMNCQYNCKNTCPPVNQLPEGMASCTPDTSDYPQWGITYLGTQILGCLPQGAYNQQPPLPNCPNDIVCKEGYNLVDGECVEISGKYRIALDSHIYVSGVSQGTPADPSTLYTWRYTGVYINEWRRPEDKMTPDYNPLASNTPYKYVKVTLNGNGAEFDWNNNHGPSITSNVAVNFTGFYENTSTVRPLIDSRGYITELGQEFGMYTDRDQTWHAVWGGGSVFLPVIERPGYTFDGWYDQQTNGIRISVGNENVSVSPDQNVTWYAHWGYKPYDVKYDCGTGDGGYSMDSATYGQTYVVKDNDGNFISCSKPGNEIMNTPAAEFTDWQFSGDFHSYDPGQSFIWNFDVPQPTFTAQYRNCVAGQYFADARCMNCPAVPEGETLYTSNPVTATSQNDCFRNCPIECNHVCPDDEGVLACTNYTDTPSNGTQYYGNSECIGDAVDCKYYTIMCKPGYTPDYYLSTDTGTHCTKLADHEITLAANCGQGTVIPGNQEKLYTTENTGVYLNPARTDTYQMGLNSNPLVSGDWARCIVTATFNHCDGDDDPNCDGAYTRYVTVDLGFNGYYKAETNGTRYTDTRQEDGQLKSYITAAGMTDGKGYTENNTWYAHWNAGQVGRQKWPTAPTRPGRCSITAYTFGGWWTEPQNGTPVYPETTISQNVTWYAHWCESCTGSIEHGSCSAPNCTATIACDTGYGWDETQCACVATTDLTLTYRPNGGTPDQNHEYLMTFGDTFTPLPGTTYTMENNRIAYWKRVTNNCSNLPQEFDFDESYTYNCNGNTILDAQWKECHCSYTMDSGVASCETFVDNNLCKTRFECKPGYVPMPLSECGGQYLTECGVNCTICPAGTYQNGNVCTPCGENEISASGATQCTPCSEIYGDGYHANADHTQCEPNTITIDWDENGGNEIDDGSCVYGQTFTLANAPTHNNNAMQFLGWKLFNGTVKPAGTSVMCTYDNVGVYSEITDKIVAQWDECQCINPLNPHVRSCDAWFADGECKYVSVCENGYEVDPLTAYTPAAVCNPITSNITYDCGDGTGMPVTATDTATYNSDYVVKNEGGANCQNTGFNFAGWRFNGDGQLHQAGDRITWNYTSDKTFTAEYTNIQCASDEILIGNYCVKCNCTIGTGAANTSCGTLTTTSNTCEWTHPVACLTGFVNPAWNCTGTGNTSCIASCGICPANQVEVSGDCTDCRCTPDTTTGAVSCGTMSISDNMCNWGPATCSLGYGYPNIICEGSSNQSCTVKCQVCPAGTYGPNGLECESCPEGYTSPAGSTSIEDCYGNGNPYTITYQAVGGVNTATGVTDQPVIQNVTYNSGFVTKQGTIFSKTNSIITVWDTVSGGAYPELNYWYLYNTTGDTILKAHWEQCTCATGSGAESCGTLSTAGNTCNWTNPVCQDGYVSPNMQCTGTGNTNCTLTCGECQEGEVIVNGECVPCTCTTGNGAASCTPGATANNTCTAVGQCMVGYGNENGNANVVCSDTNCVVSYNECGDGWVSNENCQCEICPANTYQSGNTCVPCQNGYTSPAGSSSADACVPGAHTIHYLSNNGANETYNQGVYYGQPFVTEGGTRFTKVNNIMTQWKVKDDVTTTTFPAGIAGLSGDYVYGDTTDTTLEAQWSECGCTEGEGVVAGSCTTSVTDNLCGCSASCDEGFEFVECKCNGTTNCVAICNKVAYKADYECGSGEGIPPLSDDVHYGDTYTIKANAEIYGCHRENSTFAGWEFDGDQARYWPGTPIEWNYFAGHKFRAVYCYNCPTIAHGTCELEMPTAGQCDWNITCDMGYKLNETKDNCVPISVTLEYQSNGGTPVAGYTYEYAMSYGDGFRTLDGGAFEKSRHIFNEWQTVGLGGSFPKLNWDYTYNYAGNTTLQPNWTLCPDNTISLNNQCQQCLCTAGTGTTSCGTLSTDDDTCAWGPVSCQTGYVNPTLDCSDDTTNCTAYCTKCGNKQVEVNGTCTDCECEISGGGVNSGCGFVSNNGNICNWNPTTCELGYGNPQLTCTETDYNYDCEASCTICEAGFYGPNGRECLQCPDGYTSLPGAKSKKECFIDPNSCAPNEHIEHGECVNNTRACSIPNATSAARIWNPAIGTYGPCTVIECDAANGYHESGNACVRDTCTVAHGSAESEYVGGQWECFVTRCDPGYEPSSDSKSCVECANRYVDGDLAVSSYVSECEIAACMYQGQKYALDTKNNECVPICTMDRFTREDPNNPTGTIQWDERTKKCIRTCKPGYKMW